jgi:hypothetical protein
LGRHGHTFADRGRHTFCRPGAHIADREDTELLGSGASRDVIPVRTNSLVARDDALISPARAGKGPNEYEQMLRVHPQ